MVWIFGVLALMEQAFKLFQLNSIIRVAKETVVKMHILTTLRISSSLNYIVNSLRSQDQIQEMSTETAFTGGYCSMLPSKNSGPGENTGIS